MKSWCTAAAGSNQRDVVVKSSCKQRSPLSLSLKLFRSALSFTKDRVIFWLENTVLFRSGCEKDVFKSPLD